MTTSQKTWWQGSFLATRVNFVSHDDQNKTEENRALGLRHWQSSRPNKPTFASRSDLVGSRAHAVGKKQYDLGSKRLAAYYFIQYGVQFCMVQWLDEMVIESDALTHCLVGRLTIATQRDDQ